jgi:carboxymethylenebutenolidase
MDAHYQTLATADGEMPMYEAIPADAARGAVIVIQEAFGITTHIEDVTTRAAAAGWRAVAPALFHRTGSPVASYEDFEAVKPAMGALSVGGILVDVDATLTYLAGIGFESHEVGIVGFCMGGSVACFVAGARAIGAAVTFYGGGVTQGRFGFPPLVEVAPAFQTPWLGLFGDLDGSIPPEDVEALRTAAATANVDTEIVRYPEATHGFNCDDRPAAYNEAAAKDGWARTLAWFDAHLATP